MIDIFNLRLENHNDWTRLVADISSDVNRTDKESTIWVALKSQNADMFTTDVYNMFLFMPLYMSMYYGTDLHIHGCVSKELYRNVIDYVQPLMCCFSDKLSYTKVIVDGFKEASRGGNYGIIGTGISCGVDCLSTVYKYYEMENDFDYKINGLFMLNCGWHGDFYADSTMTIYKKRCVDNKNAADELGIPFYMVDSNLHAFLPYLNDQASYFNIYTCVFAMEKVIRKYYISSSFSYNEIILYGIKAYNRDFSEYADPIVLPLMHSTNLELISDGCQYSRSKKTELISEWSIAKRYLNVCCINDSEKNCSICNKCLRTLIALDSMNKLKEFDTVFDISAYRKVLYAEKCKIVRRVGRDAFDSDNYEYCKKRGMKFPSKTRARLYILPVAIRERVKKIIGKLRK